MDSSDAKAQYWDQHHYMADDVIPYAIYDCIFSKRYENSKLIMVKFQNLCKWIDYISMFM